jgi:ATP-binding cassette subfamily B protein
MNMGNLSYVVVALAGCAMLAAGTPNPSIAGVALSIDIVVPFLNLTKRFSGSIGQVSQQINFVVMGLAGAERIFSLIDEEPEVDDGYVTSGQRAQERQRASSRSAPSARRAGPGSTPTTMAPSPTPSLRATCASLTWTLATRPTTPCSMTSRSTPSPARRWPSSAPRAGQDDHHQPAQPLLRHCDDGKIRYDGININKIKKADLRRSLGMVLQDTNLFTGTVMDNIRYGRLDATDEECIGAAKLAGADSFIQRLPEGYNTMLPTTPHPSRRASASCSPLRALPWQIRRS